MGGITNGIAYHGGFLPVLRHVPHVQRLHAGGGAAGGTGRAPRIYVWTHDSVGLGEDGPTHQPVEHYAALRAIPNLDFVRPGDANETSAAWALAVERTDGPVALALTRQKLPVLAGTDRARSGRGRPRWLHPARGIGRVAGAVSSSGQGRSSSWHSRRPRPLDGEGIPTRVVSLPCWERFDLQDRAYRDAVLPPDIRKRVSVEVGVSLGWERWVGDEGAIVGLDHFGASAPAGTIFEKFGFTADRVADIARRVVRDGLHGRIPTLDGGHFGHHPTIGNGESGVARTSDSDPGHS